MGHIQLASPVSHIWYFKGTPEPPRHPARHQPPQPGAHPLLRPVHRHRRGRGRPRARARASSRRRPRGGAARAARRCSDSRTSSAPTSTAQKDELTAALGRTKAELEAERTRADRGDRRDGPGRRGRSIKKLGAQGRRPPRRSSSSRPARSSWRPARRGGKEATARLRKIAADEIERVNGELQQREADEERSDGPEGRGRCSSPSTPSSRPSASSCRREAEALSDEIRRQRDEIERSSR